MAQDVKRSISWMVLACIALALVGLSGGKAREAVPSNNVSTVDAKPAILFSAH